MPGAMRVGIIAEGEIDCELLKPFLAQIAQCRAQLGWPVLPEDVTELFPIRKSGHGGVVDKVSRLVEVLRAPNSVGEKFELFVVILDGRKTQEAQNKVKKLIRSDTRFVFGVAIQEIEAWWLGDRPSTLAWLRLRQAPDESRYSADRYAAERDDKPKKTLDELIRLSDAIDEVYGDGNLRLARDFAEQWNPRLRSVEAECPKGFKPFCKKAANAFRRAKGRTGRLF